MHPPCPLPPSDRSFLPRSWAMLFPVLRFCFWCEPCSPPTSTISVCQFSCVLLFTPQDLKFVRSRQPPHFFLPICPRAAFLSFFPSLHLLFSKSKQESWVLSPPPLRHLSHDIDFVPRGPTSSRPIAHLSSLVLRW